MKMRLGILVAVLTLGVAHAEEAPYEWPTLKVGKIGPPIAQDRAPYPVSIDVANAEEASDMLTAPKVGQLEPAAAQPQDPFAASREKGMFYAQNAETRSSGESTDSGGKKWEFDIRPYAWLLNMDGHITGKGHRTKLDYDLSDILDDLEWGGSLKGEIKRGKFGVFVDLIIGELSRDGKVGSISADVDVDITLVEFGAFYRWIDRDVKFLGGRRLTTEPYIGGRWVDIDSDVKIKFPMGAEKISPDQDWLDLIIGSRTTLQLGPKWQLKMENNIGGFDIGDSSDFSRESTLLFGRDMTKKSTFLFGYRYLDIDYDHGSGVDEFKWDASISGPMVAVNIHL